MALSPPRVSRKRFVGVGCGLDYDDGDANGGGSAVNRREAVALGEAPADLVVRGGRVFRPETRTFDDVAVAVVDGTVAALPEDAASVTGPETTVVEATDRVVVPGFVDAHTHLDLHQSFDTAYHYALRGGTTSFVTEASGIGTAFGAAGVEALLDALADLPVTVRATVPPQALFDTFGPAEEARGDAFEALLDDPRVVGVGESAWVHVVGREPPAERLYEHARDCGKTVTGHGAGCSGATLQAFAGTVTDDHEAITSEGVEARVEHGVHAIGRCGSIRDDLDAFAEAYETLGASELSLCTDGVWPRDLLDGCMDAVVERAIDAGIAPVDALRMATLNPARHFGLGGKGTLAPGSDADVVILEDLETVDVASVVADGDVVVHNHDLRVGPRAHDYPDEFYDAVRTPSADAWRVPVDATDGSSVEAIAYDEGLFSAPTTVEPTRENGELRADPANDIAKIGLFDRRDGESGFVGFCTGFGIEGGALATTGTWETPGVLGLGVNDADLRQAVAHVGELGGGWAVVRDGEVLVDLPYSIGGVASARDVEETAQLLSAVEEATRRLGIDAARPLLGVQTLTFTGVPARKLTFGGYAEIRERAVVGLAPQ
ncbi:adenine deaminase [Halarchaeum grantii]|uniref:adenine deaminase n=1 Tax=Halarchaeum grantii TaxID=1193105 RepID=A0A830ESH1_9EURY|nr:adenine deaminase C-terminal domain-containing protein [Halarchaeum grantii]GGL24978.1 adenine deaminase [Halarchaeum grantii]